MYNTTVIFPDGYSPYSENVSQGRIPGPDLMAHCRNYRGSEFGSAMFQLLTTIGLFLAAMGAILAAFAFQMYALTYLMMLPAAGLLVRVFIIQHDCGHASFFKSRRVNDMVGRALSILTFTPYDVWRRSHNMHHASSGNLSQRGVGSIDTLTVKEYQALAPRQRLAYRIYRNPFILLLLATPIYVILIQRYPSAPALPYFADYKHLPVSQTWKSVVGLDAALMLFYGAFMAAFGWKALLFVFIPTVALTSLIGGWLFYIQHQFEDSYWNHKGEWDFQAAALHGSSYYVLPKVLQWFSGNIGLHHIHHLCPTIPNYKLQECLDDNAELQHINRMTLRESLKCIRWALWDEEHQKMIAFRDLNRLKAAQPPACSRSVTKSHL